MKNLIRILVAIAAQAACLATDPNPTVPATRVNRLVSSAPSGKIEFDSPIVFKLDADRDALVASLGLTTPDSSFSFTADRTWTMDGHLLLLAGTGSLVLDTGVEMQVTGSLLANTFTASGTSGFIADGAASVPAMLLTGTPYTAGTTTTNFPLLYLDDGLATPSSSLSANGTYIGINMHGTQDGINVMKDGVSKFKVSNAGAVSASSFVGALTGNADSATKLATARAINGVDFDGTAPVTVTAAAGTLTGSTLASGVTGSSLTGVGALSSGSATTGFTINLGSVTLSGAASGMQNFLTGVSTLAAVNGGTNHGTWSNNGGMVYASDSTHLAELTNAASGVLTSTGTASHATWQAAPTLDGTNFTNLIATVLTSGPIPAGVMPALTGDVTTSAGAVATTIGTGKVTDAKLANAAKPAVAVVATTNQPLLAEQTIDGVTTSGSLVLCTAQGTGSQNGPWVTASGAWTRPTWYSAASTTQAPQYCTVFVRLGTHYQGSTWRMTTASVTIDTTSTTWVVTPHALNSDTVSGTIGAAIGGTGVDGSAAANGKVLIGNGSGYTLALIAGTTNQIVSTPGAGTITLSLPQDIATSSGPTFASLILGGTGGAGYLCLPYQSAAPSTPGASKALLYAGSAGKPTWMQPDGIAAGVLTEGHRGYLEIFTDCISTSGSDGFAASTGGSLASATTMTTAVSGHPGIRALSTGSTSTGRAGQFSDAQLAWHLMGEGPGYFEACCAVTTLSDGTETYTFRAGLLNSNSAESTDGVFFRYTHAENSGHWTGVCRASSTETTADLTNVVTASQYDRLRFEYNAAGTSVTFYVNGSSRGTITTNIPTAAHGLGCFVLKSAGTTSRTVSVDYIGLHEDLTTPR